MPTARLVSVFLNRQGHCRSISSYVLGCAAPHVELPIRVLMAKGETTDPSGPIAPRTNGVVRLHLSLKSTAHEYWSNSFHVNCECSLGRRPTAQVYLNFWSRDNRYLGPGDHAGYAGLGYLPIRVPISFSICSPCTIKSISGCSLRMRSKATRCPLPGWRYTIRLCSEAIG